MLRDLFEILIGELKEYQYNFSQLYKFIQSCKEIVYLKDIPEASCLCDICKNTVLMVKSLSKLKKHHPKDPHTIAEAFSCDSDNFDCMMGDCKKITVKVVRPLFEEISDSTESKCEENERSIKNSGFEKMGKPRNCQCQSRCWSFFLLE